MEVFVKARSAHPAAPTVGPVYDRSHLRVCNARLTEWEAFDAVRLGLRFYGGVLGVFRPRMDLADSYVPGLLAVLCYLNAISVCIAGAGAGGKN